MVGNISDKEISLLQNFLIYVSVALIVACLVDILKSKFESDNRMKWILIVILLPIVGAILYFFVGRQQKI
jgi:hypothetical protein